MRVILNDFSRGFRSARGEMLNPRQPAELARDCLATQADLNADLRADLSVSLALSTDEVIKAALESIQKTVLRLRQLATRIEMMQRLEIKAIESAHQTLKTELESSLAALKQAVHQAKGSVLKKLSQQHLRDPQYWRRLDIPDEQLNWAKWRQHTLVLLRTRLNTLKPWLFVSQPMEIPLPHHWLAREEYADWMTVLALVKPHQLSSLNGSNGFKVNGEAAGDASGRSVSGVGDLNKDGYIDFAIGSLGHNTNTGVQELIGAVFSIRK